ncbi:FecCD family ABC transporter permease (plasmid) [Agrobacterium rosae]|nr:iron chelate uptake ABC transporter family permease subunit [Agrobacterium rosae]
MRTLDQQTVLTETEQWPTTRRTVGHGRLVSSMLFALAALLTVTTLSFVVGTRSVALDDVWSAFFNFDASSATQIIVRDYRLPRTLLGLLCGSAFGVAGALIQAMTRNPLADPGILGVNAGAAFFITLSVGVFGWHSIDLYIWVAFAGAVVSTIVVYGLGAAGRYGATPVRLVLTGVALAAFLGGVESSITLLKPQAFGAMRMWAIGSIAARDMSIVGTAAPFIGVGLVLAIAIAPSLNAVALGDDMARLLGNNILRTRLIVVIAVTLLAGAATAAVGPIGFVGLMVPHVVRWLIGPDQRWIMVFTILLSPVLLLSADILGRIILHPGELEAGIVTAFVGAPVLIFLVRKKGASSQ